METNTKGEIFYTILFGAIPHVGKEGKKRIYTQLYIYRHKNLLGPWAIVK